MTSEAPPRNADPLDAPDGQGAAVGVPLCGWCQAPLPTVSKGRPRAYCDLSCKSKAARRRNAARPKPPAAEQPAPASSAQEAPRSAHTIAQAAEEEPAGPRRRVLELADALTGAAYYYVRTLDDGDPARALTMLRTAVPRFAAQLLEAAQTAHDDAQALIAHPLENLGEPAENLGDPAVSNRRFETAAPVGGMTNVVPDLAAAVATGRPDPAATARPGHLDGRPAHLDGPTVSNRRFENQAWVGGTTGTRPEVVDDPATRPPAVGDVPTTSRPGGPGGNLGDPAVSNRRFETAAPVGGTINVVPDPAATARPAHLDGRPAHLDGPTVRTAADLDGRPGHLDGPVGERSGPLAPPTPWERGFGDCDVLLALPQLGSDWELAGWKDNQLAYFVLHDGEIVGWVEIGIGAVPRWAAITGRHFLTDPVTGELLFHTGPELAARSVRQAHLAR